MTFEPQVGWERGHPYLPPNVEPIIERSHMDGERHTHEETVKDEHQTEDGRVETEVTEKTEAEKPAEDE